jgi:hypothetical protein
MAPKAFYFFCPKNFPIPSIRLLFPFTYGTFIIFQFRIVSQSFRLPPQHLFFYNTNYNNTDWPGKSNKVEKSGFHPRRYGFARSKSAKTMYNASDSGSDKLTDGNTGSFWRMGGGKKCEKNSLCFHTGYFYPAIRLPPQIPTAGFFL